MLFVCVCVDGVIGVPMTFGTNECSCWLRCAPPRSSRPKLCVGADPHCADIIFVSFGVSAPGLHRLVA